MGRKIENELIGVVWTEACAQEQIKVKYTSLYMYVYYELILMCVHFEVIRRRCVRVTWKSYGDGVL